MKEKTKMITLPCNCRCCMFVAEKSIWEDGDVYYNLSIQDSRYGHNYNTIWGRMKRAFRILFGKPIYYNDVFMEGEEAFSKFIEDLLALKKFQNDEEGFSS